MLTSTRHKQMVPGTKAKTKAGGKVSGHLPNEHSRSDPLAWVPAHRRRWQWAGTWQVHPGLAESRKYPVSRTSPLVSPPARMPARQAWEKYRIHDKEKVLDCDPVPRTRGGSAASAPARPGSVGRRPPLTTEFQLLVVKR